ncbi:predicted protein [Chaetoceros tenuissimus]|uniref:Uncharacterized protein n=1 Tax=Chaetoceros tenuissimus TaxID=426638 RepID=A0AAD3HAJ6_9STRA|nr:predicted protein [Chaetoceros tenuissimus]
MGKSKPNASLIKLKTLLQSAIEKYNEQSIKKPFWFVYHKPSAHDMVIEATRDLPTIANVLGMNNEELSELVDKAGRNVFTTIENSLNIATNSYYRSKFFMLGNKENILDIHTPDEQFDEDFEIPNWVRRIPKLVGGATADSSSVENDSNSTSKTVRGKDKRIKYSCGTCGE